MIAKAFEVFAYTSTACFLLYSVLVYKAYQEPPVDEGVAEDHHWAGVEAEWLEYVDSFGVLEEA